MSDVERREIDERRRYLEHHPDADGRTTYDVAAVSGLRLFDDGTWRIAYRVADDASVVIVTVRHIFDLRE